MFIGSTYISESVYAQLQLFGAAILWGAAIGLAYDGLRIARYICQPPGWLHFAEDVIFWIGEALVIYRLMFKYNDGAIRSYTMIGILLGMVLYLWLLGRWLPGIIESLLDCLGQRIRKILSKIWNFFKKPVNCCSKMLKKKKKEGKIGTVGNRLK